MAMALRKMITQVSRMQSRPGSNFSFTAENH
jgi:hypothetical protein